MSVTGGRGIAGGRQWLRIVLGLMVCGLWSAGHGIAGSGWGALAQDQETITVPISKSRVVDLRQPVARVSIADPSIADILVINPSQLYVNGKELGSTNMILWDSSDRVQRQIGLEVTHDLQALKEKLYRFLPGERIRVESAQGVIVLSGEVSSAPKMDAALRLAESYAGDAKGQPALPGGEARGKVINLLQLGGAQQVLLEVKVAEIQRALSRSFDIDFAGLYDGGSIKIGAVNGGANFPPFLTADDLQIPTSYPEGYFGRGGMGGAPIPQFTPNDAAINDSGIFANFLNGNFYFNVVLDIAKTEGLAKILAEPNLTTLSGQEAEFLSGGEFPVPVSNNQGSVSIEYKKFGIQLIFVPFVLDSGLISLKVNVSVSELSDETAVAVSPTETGSVLVVPSLRTRGANATVEVPTGQTIAIAGLLSEKLQEGMNKFPGLGNLPVIGALFRSQEFQKGQTELMIFVTPRLARSYDPELVKLPTDNFVEPNEVEFYLMGRLEGQRRGAKARSGSAKGSAPARNGRLGPDKTGSEGPFGHDL